MLPLPAYFNNMFNTNMPNELTQPHRTIRTPRKYEDTVNSIPIFNPFLPINYTNTKTCRLCIRHKIPELINENYLPPIVMNKIDTHSYQGFTQYAKKYIVDMYESACNIPNCYVCTS